MAKTLRELLDVPTYKHLDIEEIHNENDMIKLSLSMMTIYVAKLIPIFTAASITGRKVKDIKSVVADLSLVMEYLFILCNSCNYEIPDDTCLEDFEDTVPLELKHDSILGLQSVIGSISELSYLIYVDMEGEVWKEDDLSFDFDELVCTIIVGIKNLGIKHGFTMEEVIDGIS